MTSSLQKMGAEEMIRRKQGDNHAGKVVASQLCAFSALAVVSKALFEEWEWIVESLRLRKLLVMFYC